MKRAYTYNFLRALASVAVLAAATAGLAACSEDSAEPAPQGVDREIRLSAEIASSPQGGSKAPVADSSVKAVLTGIHFLKKDSITTPTTFAGLSPLVASRNMAGQITFATGTTPTYDKVTNLNAYLVGYWPGTATTAGANKVSWTINGKTDILVAPLWNAGSYTTSRSSGMLFEHQLAQLEVVCRATSASGVTASEIRTAWGNITKIELVNNFSTASYNYLTQGVEFENQSALALLKPDYATTFASMAIPDAGSTAVTAAGMFAPQAGSIMVRVTTATRGAVNLEVQLRKGTQDVDFERSKRHRITIDFEKTQLQVATYTDITDWSTAFETDSEIDMPSDVLGQLSEGVIDMRHPSVMKTGQFNSTSHTITSIRSSYNAYVSRANAAGNGGYQSPTVGIGEPAYYKFEVAKANETAPAGTGGWNAEGTRANWATAWAACKAKAPAGAWRLPRASELCLMEINKTALQGSTGFTAFERTPYATGVEESSTDLVETNFSGGLGRTSKAGFLPFRCVRELGSDPVPAVPAVEDYYYSDGTFSWHNIAGKTLVGVVYWVDPANPKHFKIVSIDEESKMWCVNDEVTGVTSETDGKANTLTLMRRLNALAYAGALWCYKKNTGLTVPAPGSVTMDTPGYGWYLPARKELQYVTCAYYKLDPEVWLGQTPTPEQITEGYPAAWNARFTAGGGAAFATGGYLTSTEFADAEVGATAYSGYKLSTPSGGVVVGVKRVPAPTRCIKEVTLP